MKVVIISTYSIGATVSRVVSIINALKYNEVHLIGAISKGNLESNPSLENKDVIVHHIPLWNSTSRVFFFRFLSEFIYSFKCSLKAKTIKADREIVTIPFSSLIITSIMIRSANTSQILDIRDLVWEYLNPRGQLGKIISRVFKNIHLYYAKRFDHITVTNAVEYRILANDLKKFNITIMSNGISKYLFNYLNDHNFDLPVLRSNNIIITYIGNVGLLQNLSTFVEAVQEMKGFTFRIVGDGNDFNNIRKKIEDSGINNVELVGRVPNREIISFYKSTHVLYAKLDENITSAVPSKLYEYLTTGKPIIYSGKGAAINLLRDFENVYICKDEIKEIQKVLLNIKHSSASSSIANKQLIKMKFIRENIYKSFMDLV